jgi:hypothetical protein
VKMVNLGPYGLTLRNLAKSGQQVRWESGQGI